jgi:uncharacterized protein (TIGR03083 family)
MDYLEQQATVVDLGAVYAEQRRRIAELVRVLPAADLLVRCPTCPDWTVRDVVGHLTGLMSDVRTRNLAGLGTTEWTRAQVAAFAAYSLEAVLEAWAALAEPAERDFAGIVGAPGMRLISDAFTHEHDIRGAVRRPGGRESAAMAVALRVQLDALATRLGDAALPGLELRCADGGSFVVGPGEPAGVVEFPTTWDMLRTMCARRSQAQLRACSWRGVAVEDYLDAFFRFAPPVADIAE